MKKDNVLLYDGGFIDYEKWNAPIIMDLKGLSMNGSIGITAYGYEERKEAFAIPCIENYQTLYAVVNEYREDSDIHYGYNIVVKEERYLMPEETIAINGRTLAITDVGAWLVSKATLIRITATKGDEPTLEFIHEDDYLRTLGTKKGQDGEKKMDMETLNQCSQLLQKANKQSKDKLEAEFTAEELDNFANGKTTLTVPLVYEDEDKIQHNAGEVTLTHVKYGETNNEGIIAETFCWPHQLNDVGTQEVVFALQVHTQDMDLLSFEFACDRSPSRHVGFLPFGLDCIVPVNVTISRKTNGEKHDNEATSAQYDLGQKDIKPSSNKDTTLQIPMRYLPEPYSGYATVTLKPSHNILIISLDNQQPIRGICKDNIKLSMSYLDEHNSRITKDCQIIYFTDRLCAIGSYQPDLKPEGIDISVSKNPVSKINDTQHKIAEKCDAIKNLLLEKNRKYGDSALNPVRVFSKADTVEQIKVRMDDKLSRIKNEQGDEDEDVYMDLAGYLVLMLIAKEEQKKAE